MAGLCLAMWQQIHDAQLKPRPPASGASDESTTHLVWKEAEIKCTCVLVHTPTHTINWLCLFQKGGAFLCFFNFIYFWLRWVFVAVRELSLVAASRGYASLRCMSFSLRWLLLLRSPACRRVGFGSCGSWALERRLSSCGTWHGLSCSTACGIFPDQGSNPCPLH